MSSVQEPTTALSDSETSPSPPLKPLSRSASHSQPRGILKNSGQQHSATATRQPAQGLVWDEANLSLNEVQKDSTMKITEPKTPYVRYNAETDTVMDLDKIPGFELGTSEDVAMSPPLNSFSLDGGPGSPTSSVGAGAGAGGGSRRGSEASEKMVKVEAPLSSSGGEEEEDEEEWDEETRQHRRQFAQKRGGHYRNEAEAMKRAQALLAAEDEDSESGAEGGKGGGVPPVPKVPNGL